MAGIDEVLERLVTDAGFRTQLQEDPRSALEGYVLYDEDLEVLAATVDEGEGAEHGVEQRTSKSAFLSAFLLGDLGGGRSGGSSGDLALPGSEPSHEMGSPYLKKACFDNTFDDTDVSKEELVAPQDGGDASMTKSELTTPLARPPSENDAPIDDLAADDGAQEEAELTYPGVYVQEVPSPDAEPPAGGDAAGSAGLRSDGELVQASVTPDVPEAAGPSDVRGLPQDDGGAGPNRPAYETIELVPHTITYAEPTGAEPIGETDLGASNPSDHGGGSEQAGPDPTLIGKITPKPLTDEPDAPAEAEGNEVAIETVVIQTEGVDPEPDARVGGDATETIGANRDVTIKGSKIQDN